MALEQLIPGTIEWDAYYANHIFRYRFALHYLKEHQKYSILDAATGAGYGAHFLASNGIKSVTAIDRNNEALKIAGSQFKHEAIKFLKDDCHTLEAAESHAPYDAIVSFETLEHLPRPDDFLKRCYHVLKPGGVIIVSTPNVEVSLHASRALWQFHEKDYTPLVLEDILKRHGFADVKIMGQGMSESGMLRQDVRGELNKIYSNPFMRMGSFLQKTLKNHKQRAILPESISDFVLIEPDDVEGRSCFVIIAVATKPLS
jgi:ubiquinone/menaquinone biosynthesis C-methylase UbiE